MSSAAVAAVVAGEPVLVDEIDEREKHLRATRLASALPRPGTTEGRQLRRWLTQLVVAERVVAAAAIEPAEVPELCGITAPTEADLLPDTAARLEIGSVAASTLAAAQARAVFMAVTATVTVSGADVAAYHARNPLRFAATPVVGRDGWRRTPIAPPLADVEGAVRAHLLAAARRREFRRWLDERCAQLVDLAPGYEHPGDPRQPDNTHRH
jgi:[acyl-carrier-protein] S-malonyltransferase